MAAVADYSFSRPDPAALKAAGYTGVMRYLAPDNAETHGKLILPAEYQALQAAGLVVTLNFEWSSTRPTQGHDAGYSDAQIANQQAASVGYPPGQVIYYSVDTQATVDQIRPYFQGIHDAGGPYSVGYYGGQPAGLALMQEGLVGYLWVANAASWSGFPDWQTLRAGVDPRAHLIQHLDHPLGFAGQIDHNEVLRDDYSGADMTPDQANQLAAIDLRVADIENKIVALYNATFDFHNASGLSDIAQRVTNVATAVGKLAAPASGAVDVTALTAAIQALPHEVVVELRNALPAS